MSELRRAAELLRAGELVAFPTETVYGLGADAANPAAVAKIFAAKGRPADHPLIVHLADARLLERWARDIPPAAHALAAAFWPGPLTLILKRAPGVSDAVTGGQDTVGLRVPDHPLALALLREFAELSGVLSGGDGRSGRSGLSGTHHAAAGLAPAGGLAAPSANRFGRISPTTAAHVREELGERVAMVLDGGPCAVGIESTILDLSGAEPTILRPGMLDAAALATVLGRPPAWRGAATGAGGAPDDASDGARGRSPSGGGQGGASATPRVSGSLDAHYAPRTPLRLVPSDGLTAAVAQALADGRRVALLARQSVALDDPRLQRRPASADSARYAQELYARLRELDGLGADLIIVEAPPAEAGWRAIADRLGRAAVGSGQGGAG